MNNDGNINFDIFKFLRQSNVITINYKSSPGPMHK